MGGHSVGYYQVVAQPDDELAEVEEMAEVAEHEALSMALTS